MANKYYAKPEETAIARREETYPVLAPAATVADLMRDNLGGSDFTAFDLERVKIPAAGGTVFTIQTLTGQGSAEKLTGIIVHYQDCRAYWREAFAGDVPPNCSSEDARIGVGDPGGECAKCPFAQFNTATKSNGEPGRGQACKAIRRVFLLQPKTYLPTLLTLPPTSIKACRQYMTRVTNAGLPYWGVVTEIGLEATKSGDGIAYSKATFNVAQAGGQIVALTAEETAKVREYAKALKEVMKSRNFTTDEFVLGQEEKG